jgi:hypothetical protein
MCGLDAPRKERMVLITEDDFLKAIAEFERQTAGLKEVLPGDGSGEDPTQG